MTFATASPTDELAVSRRRRKAQPPAPQPPGSATSARHSPPPNPRQRAARPVRRGEGGGWPSPRQRGEAAPGPAASPPEPPPPRPGHRPGEAPPRPQLPTAQGGTCASSVKKTLFPILRQTRSSGGTCLRGCRAGGAGGPAQQQKVKEQRERWRRRTVRRMSAAERGPQRAHR